MRKRALSRWAAALVFLLAVTPAAGQQAWAASVDPVFVAGNPSCADLGYDLEFKIEGQGTSYNGTYVIDSVGNTVTVSTAAGQYFDWSSTLGMDAVLAKGGPNANAYYYDPEAFSDTDLSSPLNGDMPYGLSHISFCYDYEVDVSKDAATSYDREFTWEITKDVDPASVDLFIGQDTTFDYDVTVDQTYTDKNFAVAGSITIANNTPMDATVTDILDTVSAGSDYQAAVDCGAALPITVASGGTLVCSYSTGVNDATDGTNYVTVSTSGSVGGGSASAGFAFGEPTGIIGFPDINVTDTNGQNWTASGDATWSYTVDQACSSDTSLYANGSYSFGHANTATIDETGQSDSETVTVNCFAPVVDKDAMTEWTRQYDWTITKDVTPASLDLFFGDSGTFDYTVSVDQTITDKDYRAYGTISVYNPHPGAGMTVNVLDVLSNATVATVDCGGGAQSLSVGSMATGTCTYSADLLSSDTLINTANVNFNGIDFQATADVVFSADPTTVIGDAEINVTDTNGQGWTASGDATWTYSQDQTCSSDQASYTDGFYTFDHPNTATIDETGQSDSETVTVNCYAPVVSKDAVPSFTRTFEWTIDKSVDVDLYNMFASESGTSNYTVALDKTTTDSDWAASGTITVVNHHPTASMTVSLADVVSPDIAAALDCSGSLTVAAGSSGTCGYSAALPDASQRVNTVTAGFNGGSFNATADVIFGEPTSIVGYDTVNLDDSYAGDLGTFGDDGSATYSRTFDCSSNPADYTDGSLSYTEPNTATIVETGQSDDESVTVNCYVPLVDKDASTSLTRTYEWDIDKAADQSDLTLAPSETFVVNYEVDVFSTATVDSDHHVSGDITVQNPNPVSDMTVSVTDMVNGTAPALDCGGSLTVAAGSSNTCGYGTDLPDGTYRVNTATVTLNGIDFTATAPVDFDSAAVSEVDECVTVDDTNVGSLGTVCIDDNEPTTFSYEMTVGPYSQPEDCGDQWVDNTASLVTGDLGLADSDDWSIHVFVPCDFGCTLTPGYWKTHSELGPAPYDETWAQVCEESDPSICGAGSVIFFKSEQTYYEVLWTSSADGHAYYILASQYIAAELNILAGASMPADVFAAYEEATLLFETYNPDQVLNKGGKRGDDLRALFIDLAATLDDYNNGLLGPGHCDEDGYSSM